MKQNKKVTKTQRQMWGSSNLLFWYTEIYVMTENQSKIDKYNKDSFIWKTGKQCCWEWRWIYSHADVHCHRLYLLNMCNICTIELDFWLSTGLKCEVWITPYRRVIDSCWNVTLMKMKMCLNILFTFLLHL